MNQRPVVAIIGTGMIASSMAVLCAKYGSQTLILSRSTKSAHRLQRSVIDFYREYIEQGIMSTRDVRDCLSRIYVTTAYVDLSEAEIVFESVAENTEAKYQVYRDLEASCPKVQVICSVSSSIVPETLAAGCSRFADRILVTHPFNPPHLVPYFEVCTAEKTDPNALQTACDFLDSMDRKLVILKKPTPGFIGNRLQFALWREALALVEEGVCDPMDIDTCLAYSFCPRYTSIGIFEHFDTGGMELNRSACRNIWPILSNRTDIPDFMEKLIADGRMGAYSEKKMGFYDWNDVDPEEYRKRVSRPYWEMEKKNRL